MHVLASVLGREEYFCRSFSIQQIYKKLSKHIVCSKIMTLAGHETFIIRLFFM